MTTNRFFSPGTRRVLIFSCVVWFGLSNALSQTHLEPAHGADGIPGLATGSFIIRWATVDTAIGYEYILSNNSLCFAGCAGDTRQAKTGLDTSGIEYNLIEGISYYWITRFVSVNGNASNWSDISSFEAVTPPEPEPDDLISLGPNPGSSNITIEIDWAATSNAANLEFKIYSLSGRIAQSTIHVSNSNISRYQYFDYATSGLQEGIYILSIVADDDYNNPIIKRIIITD